MVRRNVFISLLLIASNALLFGNDLFSREDIKGAEILAASRAAMEPPVRMSVLSNGVGSLVCKKLVGDVLAVRIESVATPGLIQLSVGDRSFELFPVQKKAIETSLWFQGIRTGASRILSSVGDSESISSTQEVDSVEDFEMEGKPCWLLTQYLPSHILDALSKQSTVLAKENIPSERKSFVEKSTGLLLKTEIASLNGRVISRIEYSDIRRDTELSDDLFLIPASHSVLEPKSREEYYVLRKSLESEVLFRDPRSTQIDPSKISRPWEHLGISESDFNASVERSLKRERERLVSGMPVVSATPSRFFVTNCLLVISFVAVFVLLEWRHRRLLLRLKEKNDD